MRRKVRTVQIGKVVLSSEQPPLIQSMLNTSTMDTEACVAQAIRIIEAGGQLVRITAQGVKEAENLKHIHALLRAKGYDTPLSADIHFNPAAASVAAHYVEKVRINPGNFVDKRATFQQLSYTDAEYAAELEILKQKFSDFLDICRENQTAVRIGTNHGSLSDRIMSRYGNTPEGMVEATLEYLRVCKEKNFQEVVISLKSSDCSVMVDAVRLLVKRMDEEGMDYPLHLGVTEAGEGEDGRIRSAIGIGTLLNEGIGDTIRVSLTEAPEKEIPVAAALVKMCHPDYRTENVPVKGRFHRPVLVADVSSAEVFDETISAMLDYREGGPTDPALGVRLKAGIKAPEMLYTEALGPELTKLPAETTVLVPGASLDMAHVYNRNACPLLSTEEYKSFAVPVGCRAVFVKVGSKEEIEHLAAWLEKDPEVVLILAPVVADYRVFRAMIEYLRERGWENKVILQAEEADDKEETALYLASQLGGFFLDRQVYGLWIRAREVSTIPFTLDLGRNILQSSGLRRYKTEFVSCPGCGRTLFDLQEAVAKVKQAFSHLNKLKIAVMGCVVNGPGEMGDADYGYVGAGNGKVNLYKNKQIVKIGIPEKEALAALKQLIQENGDWEERNQ